MSLDTSISTPLDPEVARARRPKWLALMLMAQYGYEPPAALSTSTFIDVLGRFAVSSHAVRSALSRLVTDGVLRNYRHGRETYYGITPQGYDVLTKGHALAWREADAHWDGTWTLLAYSISEDRRDLRHRIRSRLTWGGFGILRSGVWIAPRSVDVKSMLAGLGVSKDVRVFSGMPTGDTTASELIHEAYNLQEIAERYLRFVDRWTSESRIQSMDELCSFLLIRSEWQQLVQIDPRLPTEYLPTGWPASDAEQIFRSHYMHLEAPAKRIAEGIMGRLEVSALGRSG